MGKPPSTDKIKTAADIITITQIEQVSKDLKKGIPVQDLSSFIDDFGKFLMTAHRKQLTADKINMIEDILNILIARTFETEQANNDKVRLLLLKVRGKAQWIGDSMEAESLPTHFFEEIGLLGDLLVNLSGFFKTVVPIVITYQYLN